MPIYMDRHDLPGITAKDVAEAHQEDLKIQAIYGCRALTYWFDEERQTAFCLIEGPHQEAVKAMHHHAHGLVPYQIIEVDGHVVEAFLGRIEDPKASDDATDADLLVFHDPAFRTIMVTELKDVALMHSILGTAVTGKLIGLQNEIIREALNQYDGREVQYSGYGFLASFASASKAILCATGIQKRVRKYNSYASAQKLHIQIGLSAGVPVTESNELFGQAVQLAKRLCHVPSDSQVIASAMVRELYQQGLSVLDKGETIRALSLPEEKFLSQLWDIMETSWEDPGFTIHDLARQIGISKSQLYRKTVSLTGYAPNDFIKEFRLNKAVKFIQNQEGNISEIAYLSGFTSPSYFSKCFHKRFHIIPSDYASLIANPILL